MDKLYYCIAGFIVLAAALLMGCSEEQPQRPPSIVVLTSADQPPFEYFISKRGKGEIVGFDIDLVKRIGEYLSIEIEVRDVDFSAIIPSLVSGRGDAAISALSATPERAKNIDFSEVYYSPKMVVLMPKGSKFLKRDNYEGMRVGVQLGSTLEQFANVWVQARPGLEVMPLNRLGNIIQELNSGRLQAAIFEETPALAFLEHNENLEMHEVQERAEGVAIAFPKGSPLVKDFNMALAHLRDIGYFDYLADKWLRRRM